MMKAKKITVFNCSFISLLVSAVVSPTLSASAVRADIDYQYFRDFAENKGVFSIGAMNIPIFNKKGENIGVMLENIPMHDFSSVSHEGWSTLTAPQFISTATHNKAGKGNFFYVSFAATTINPDNHTFSYYITNASVAPFPVEYSDYQVSRLHKLVTEVIPVELFSPGINYSDSDYISKVTALLTNKTRFPLYLRAGGGLQGIVNEGDKVVTMISPPDPYRFLTGGIPPQFTNINGNREFWTNGWDDGSGNRVGGWRFFYLNEGGPMKNLSLGGDSGSGLIVYDDLEKKWLMIGELFGRYELKENQQKVVNNWTMVCPECNEDAQNKAKAGSITTNEQNSRFFWQDKGNASSVISDIQGTEQLTVGLATISGKNINYETGKDIIFNGDRKGKLILKNSLNQGAGALYFNTDFNVEAENNYTWVGAGVVVADGKEVSWKVSNPAGDRLSKLGKGTLLIQGSGKNLGDISVGEGLVILDQRTDEQGNKQAFNQLGIVSGRPTVKLMSADQIDPNNIYFGFRGGRLDLNGNEITFHKIAHSDSGAIIVNHNQSKQAHLRIQDDVNLDLTKGTSWNQEADYYEVDNKLPGFPIYYYLPKTTLAERKRATNGDGELPFWGEGNDYWELVGEDEKEAINLAKAKLSTKSEILSFTGFIGEPSSDKSNGSLNFTFQPKQNSMLSLAGGMNIKGDVNVLKGNLILSGDPTYHAYDHIAKKEVILDDDWQNRDYQAQNMVVTNGASLTIGRNVEKVRSNFSADLQSNLTLGYENGQEVCYRSHYSGDILCKKGDYDANILTTIPETQIIGDIRLNGQSQLKIGKAHFTGQINASADTHTTLTELAKWTLTNDSQVGNLTLQDGAMINLSSSSQSDKFNTLTVKNDLSGTENANSTHLKFRVDLDQLQGDRILVEGKATGKYLLDVQNIGQGRNNLDGILPLILLNDKKDNHISAGLLGKDYIDSGALRYRLKQGRDSIYLGNPLLTPEEQAKRQAEEAERLRLAEEKRQAEEAERLRLTKVIQSQHTSTVGNVAVAELTAQLNVSLKLSQTLSSQLLTDKKMGQVWSNSGRQTTDHQSDNYRAYRQSLSYTEIGGETARTENGTSIGGVFSYANVSNDFNEGVNENVKHRQITLYLKKYFSQQFFLSAYSSYARSHNTLRLAQEKVKFHRTVFQSGLGVGKRFSLLGLDGKWLLSGQHYHLGRANYNLNNVDVQMHSLNLFAYQGQVEIGKKFNFENFAITPMISFYYQNFIKKQIENKAIIGNHALKQDFGETLMSRLGINVEVYQNWHFTALAGLGKGNNSKKIKELGMKVTYSF